MTGRLTLLCSHSVINYFVVAAHSRAYTSNCEENL